MASAVDSRLAYARLAAVATASRLPTAIRGSNNSYTTSWDTTAPGLADAMVREQMERFMAEVAPAFDHGPGRSTAAEARIT